MTSTAPPALMRRVQSTWRTRRLRETPGREAAEPVPLPLMYRYKVQPGDTVSGLAERFDIAGYYILWNNIDVITDADVRCH